MSDEKKFDTEYTDELICPWCGSEKEALYEYFHGSDSDECRVLECDECENSFDATRHVSVEYSTGKVTPEELAERKQKMEEERQRFLRLIEGRAARREKSKETPS